MEQLERIRTELKEGDVRVALAGLNRLIAQSPSPSDELYYLLGNAYRKTGNWQMALNNYAEAIARNPESPARQAREMAMNILNFHHSERFNL